MILLAGAASALMGPSGVGSGGGSGYRYWRVLGLAGPSGANAQYSELKMRNSGVNLIGSGTVSASSEFSASFLVGNAVDNDTASAWAATGTADQWIQYDFGSAVSLDEIILQGTTSFSSQRWTEVLVQASADGSTWIPIAAFHSIADPGSLGLTTLSLPANPNPDPTGSHRYWRLWVMRSMGSLIVLGELELINASAANVARTVGGTITASSQQTGNLAASKAFDGLTTTGWATAIGVGAGWLKMDFGASPQSLAKYALSAHDTYYNQFTPLRWVLGYSDDDSTYYIADARTAEGSWSLHERREYTIPS